MIRAAVVVAVLLPLAAHAEPEGDEPEAKPDATVEKTDERETSYSFGSYGRVGVGSDLRGSTPEAVNVVQHGSRVVQDSYVELDAYYRTKAADQVAVETVATLAFQNDLFHYTGDFDTQLALRNLYAEATIREHYTLWVGSRMYRGDSIYLLDWWPLDDENTLGGGAGLSRGRLDVGIHAGLNRLTDDYQLQMVDVPDPEFGAETITQLDRQRTMQSAKASYRFYGDGKGPSGNVKLFFESQQLPKGEYLEQDRTIEKLPSDFGWSGGAQLAAWGFLNKESHANLFVRYSQGLTAHDELAVPFGFDPQRKTFPESSEFVLAWSGNFDFRRAGVMAGGYLRRFMDADGSDDMDDGWEYIADARPYAAPFPWLRLAVDVSYQKRYPRGVSPTSLMAIEPAVFQIAPMAVYSPFGTGSYTRPHFRLVYRAANLNDDALDLYAPEDPRRAHPWVHFLGMQVEWWFNSTYR